MLVDFTLEQSICAAKALGDAIEILGGQVQAAKQLGVSRHKVRRWVAKGYPPDTQVLKLAALSGISRGQLRPDLYED